MKTSEQDGIDGILFDLDGVFYVDNELIEGALETLAHLDDNRIPYCFITNTTTQSSGELRDKLAGLGIPCSADQLVTAPIATADYLRRQDIERCFFVVDEAVMKDFEGLVAVEDEPQAVVLGDIGERWSYSLLDRIFNHLVEGASLVAMHRNRYWQKSAGLHMDIGAFVAGLEYAAQTTAVITGKPSGTFFDAALSCLQIPRERALLVGDDIQSDIGGAQAAGIRGVLVKTGKYRRELVESADVEPHRIIQSIAQLPTCLG